MYSPFKKDGGEFCVLIFLSPPRTVDDVNEVSNGNARRNEKWGFWLEMINKGQ